MSDYRITRSGVDARIGMGLLVAITALLATLPWWDTDSSLRVPLVVILYYVSLSQMWNLLAGYAGLVSIGQQMFVGVGIYSMLSFSEEWGIDPYLSVPLAGVVAAVLSLPVALFAFRLKGGYFAIGTWVIAEVFRLLVLESDFLGGGNVRSLTANSLGGYTLDARNKITFLIALGLAVGSTIIVTLILRSRLGLALRAIRDSEDGARGLGMSITRSKLIVWVISAFWTGMTGALILLNSPSTRADSAFSVLRWTALVVFIAIIGGVGSTTGPIIGVLIFWFVNEQLEDAEAWRFIILGLVACGMAIMAPQGISGMVQRWKPFELLPTRRRLAGGPASLGENDDVASQKPSEQATGGEAS